MAIIQLSHPYVQNSPDHRNLTYHHTMIYVIKYHQDVFYNIKYYVSISHCVSLHQACLTLNGREVTVILSTLMCKINLNGTGSENK